MIFLVGKYLAMVNVYLYQTLTIIVNNYSKKLFTLCG